MATQAIDRHGSLPYRQIARLVQHQGGLLIHRLYCNEADAWSGERLAYRFRTAGIGLAALDVRFDIVGRHHLDCIPKRRDRAGSVVLGRTGLHAERAGRQALEKLQQIPSTDLPSNKNFSTAGNAMCLENIPCQVQPDLGYRACGYLPWWPNHSLQPTTNPGGRVVHHITALFIAGLQPRPQPHRDGLRQVLDPAAQGRRTIRRGNLVTDRRAPLRIHPEGMRRPPSHCRLCFRHGLTEATVNKCFVDQPAGLRHGFFQRNAVRLIRIVASSAGNLVFRN